MLKMVVFALLALGLVGVASAVPIGEDHWFVVRSGSETALDVDYSRVDDFSTEFCVSVNNRSRYVSENMVRGRSITDVPVSKSVGDVSFSEAKLDLWTSSGRGESACFVVVYPKGETVIFRIGWESVEIANNGAADGLEYHSSRSVCRTLDGALHVAYENSANDVAYAVSHDDGESWSAGTVETGTYNQVQVSCADDSGVPTVAVFANQPTNDDISFWETTDNGSSFSSEDVLTSSECNSASYYPSCAYFGSAGELGCVYMQSDRAWCVTSNLAENDLFNLYGSSCMLLWDEWDDDLLVACLDAFDEELQVWGRDLTGWGVGDFVTVYSGDSLALSTDHLGFSVTNDSIYFAFADNSDLWFCNTTYAGLAADTGADCQELDGDPSVMTDIAANEYGQILIGYKGGTSFTIDLELAVSDDYGASWSFNHSFITGSNNDHNFRIQTWPADLRVKDLVEIVFMGADADPQFVNYSIGYGAAEPPAGLNCSRPGGGVWVVPGGCTVASQNVSDHLENVGAVHLLVNDGSVGIV